jgi:predicted NAD-dependent protein-ADP-ribosyltransferase YbiA (DUF1768 family)
MRRILEDKFSGRNPGLRDALVATGDAELVEGNSWHDNFWGVCSCSRCKNKEGQNYLGRLLEEVRASLAS